MVTRAAADRSAGRPASRPIDEIEFQWSTRSTVIRTACALASTGNNEADDRKLSCSVLVDLHAFARLLLAPATNDSETNRSIATEIVSLRFVGAPITLRSPRSGRLGNRAS